MVDAVGAQMPTQRAYERIRVLVETGERSFRGYMHKPVNDGMRLSDYINALGKPFVCLSEAQVNDRGQAYRPGEKREFVAISVSAITYITPLKDGES